MANEVVQSERVEAVTEAKPSARAISFVDPATLMKAKNLQFRARVVVEGFYSGLHRSPYHGFSVEFSEYREYSPGDDLRYLDWRLFARSDRYYVKRFEDETNLRCHLLVDLSRSMSYGSGEYSKADYARTLAATLAYFLTTQRDSVGLLTFADVLSDYLPARYRPGHLHRLMVSLERAESGTRTDLMAPIEQAARIITKRGMVILISDLLADVDLLEQKLGYLRSQGHEVIVLQVLDTAEIDFTFRHPSMFHDLESNRRIYVDPETAKETYLERFQQHQKTLRRTFHNLGIDHFLVRTDQPMEMVLFEFLGARARRGRTSQRTAEARPAAGGSA